jgi:hypothetical protein
MRQRQRRAPPQPAGLLDLKGEGHVLIVASGYPSGSRSRSTAGISRMPCVKSQLQLCLTLLARHETPQKIR